VRELQFVDGEVCVLDSLGRSDFERLQARPRKKGWSQGADPVVFCIFDVLVRSGRSVIGLPYVERKHQLRDLFTPRPRHTLLVVDGIAEHGKQMFEYAVALELEGLVAKKKDSIYLPGQRTTDWRKLRRPGAVPPERFKFR
jgi:bifunctional non-homologous end joining protein LigD